MELRAARRAVCFCPAALLCASRRYAQTYPLNGEASNNSLLYMARGSHLWNSLFFFGQPVIVIVAAIIISILIAIFTTSRAPNLIE